MRIFVLGARAESSLPREAWIQLCYLFPRARFHIIMIGPESMANRDDEFPLPARTATNPFGGIVEDRISHELKITTFVEYYQTMHKANYFHPYDPYFDCFMLYHPGLGHPASSHEWAEVIPQLLETKVPILVTGYSPYDMERDAKFVKETVGGEMDMLLEPGENIFRSLRWDLNDLDPQDVSCGNWGLWGFRGKRFVVNTLVRAIMTDHTPGTRRQGKTLDCWYYGELERTVQRILNNVYMTLSGPLKLQKAVIRNEVHHVHQYDSLEFSLLTTQASPDKRAISNIALFYRYSA